MILSSVGDARAARMFSFSSMMTVQIQEEMAALRMRGVHEVLPLTARASLDGKDIFELETGHRQMPFKGSLKFALYPLRDPGAICNRRKPGLSWTN